ncbi:MAG: hypothetical protein ACKO2P_19110 [Planctomycetota bacterium]
MKWPNDRFLQSTISWLMTGWFWKLIFSQPPQSATTGEAIEQAIGLFFIDLVSPLMFGAICSEFWLVSLCAFSCGAVLIATLTLEKLRSADAAKAALATYFLLTMFTLWLEPWMTWNGAVVKILEVILKMSTMVVDIGVSIVAFLLWQKVAARVTAELA